MRIGSNTQVSEEHGERRGPRHEPGRGQSGGHSDQVLLSDAHLQESVGVGLGELVRLRGSGQVPILQHHHRAPLCRARRASPPTHPASPSSCLCSVRGVPAGSRSSGSSSCRASSKSSSLGTMLCQVCTPSASERPLPLTVCASNTVGRPLGSPSRANLQGVDDLVVVVTVDLENPPAKGLEHRGQVDAEPGIPPVTAIGEGRGHFRRRPVQLFQSVPVDDGGQVGEPVAGRGLHRLPHHAFLNLPVPQQNERVEILARQPGPERHPDARGQTLAE